MSGSKAEDYREQRGNGDHVRIRDHQPQCDNTINAPTVGSNFGFQIFGIANITNIFDLIVALNN